MIFSGHWLARRLEAAEAENDADCAAAHPGSAVEVIAGGRAIFAGAGSPLTRALGPGFAGRVTAAELDRLERFFCSRGAVTSIDICPLCDSSLIDLLAERGYRATEFNNVLVRALSGMAAWPEEALVERVPPDAADVWARTAGCGFFEQESLTSEEMEVGRAIFEMGKAECYLARLDGEPVATAALSIRDGVGLLFADSTLNSFRRKGLHAALLRARLASAAAHGCDLAASSVAPGSASQRNYERHGFQVAYTRVLMVKP